MAAIAEKRGPVLEERTTLEKDIDKLSNAVAPEEKFEK